MVDRDIDLGTLFSGGSLALRLLLVLGVIGSGSFGFGMLLGSSVVTNPGEKAVKTSGGEFVGVVGEGIHPGIPMYDSYRVFDMRQNLVNKSGSNGVSALTRDNINVRVDLKVRWDISDDESLERIYKEVAKSQDNLRTKVVVPAIEEAPRTCATQRTAVAIGTEDRTEYQQCIENRLEENLQDEGLTINSVEIVNVEYPRSLQNKFEERRNLEEQERIADRQLAITRKESEQQVIEAEKRAEAIRTVRSELSDDYVRYYAIEEGMSNANTIYVVPAENGVPFTNEITTNQSSP